MHPIPCGSSVQTSAHLQLQQFWREEPEPGFQSGIITVHWKPQAWIIQAVLQDRDSFNPVQGFNQPAYLAGDVFELFLQPPGREDYFEFHVGPDNQLYQLQLPSAEQFATHRHSGVPTDWFIETPHLESTVTRQQDSWTVEAKVPVEMLGIERIATDQLWKLSFCRYDRNRNPETCVLSSTSPLNEVDFHRIYEWSDVLTV